MDNAGRSRVLWVSLLAAAAAVAWGLYASGRTLPPRTLANSLGFRGVLTPEIKEGARISERFTMNANQFTGIDIRASAVSAVRGLVHLELRSLSRETPEIVRGTEVPAEEIVRSEIFQFRFDPIIESRNVRYEFEISASPRNPSAGVALWATKGRPDVEHVLLFNGVERFADLVFQTRVVPPAPIIAPVRWQVWFALVALAVSWMVLVTMLNRLAAASS